MATPNPQYWTDDDWLAQSSYESSGPDTNALQTPEPSASTSSGTFFDMPSYQPAVEPQKQTQPVATGTGLSIPSPTANTSAGNTDAYSGLVSQIKAASDPNQKIVLQDQLARQVYNDLKAAGHDVKWQGEQLMVDGRAYVLGDGTTVSDPLLSTTTPPGPGWTRVGQQWANPNTYVNGQQVNGSAAAGFDPNQWGSQDPAYINQLLDYIWQQTGQAPMAPDDPRRAYWIQKLQTPDVNGANQQLLGNDPYWQMRMGYDARGEDYEAQFQPPTLAPSYGVDAPGAAGVTTSVNLPAAPPAPAPFALSAPSYTPGEIDTLDDFDPLAGSEDLSDATKQKILDMLTGGEPVDDATEQALLRLLANPSSLDDRTVEMMKAKSREEQAAMMAGDDEAMRAAGFAGGFDDSRWLASARAANRAQHEDAILANNRDVDIQAATQRAADTRSAIELGTSYGTQKAARDAQAVQASQSFLALQSDNAFKLAAAQGDRLALKESIAQKATELGLSADQLLLNYTLGVMQDATQRYGIDVGASIDRAKLAQAGEEFQLDLALKYAQLEQADAQFGASYGLDLAKYQSDDSYRNNDLYLRSIGL
jgi:hypothetical protein